MAGAVVKVAILGDERGLKVASKEAQGDLKRIEEGHKGVSKAAKYTALAVTGGAALLAKGIYEQGSKAIEAQDHLQQAFDRTRVKGGKWVAQAEADGQRFGHAQSEIDEALAVGVRGLGNASLAHRALNIAMDITAATGKPLAESMLIATKAAEGNTKALKGLGIDTRKLTDKAKDLKAATTAYTKANNEDAKAAQKLADARYKLMQLEERLHAKKKLTIADHQALQNAQDAVTGAMQHANNVAQALGKAETRLDQARKEHGNGLDLLSDKYKGSAANAAKTLQGQLKALHAWFQNLEAKIGKFVIPLIMKLATWLGKHKPILVGIAGAIALVVAGLTTLFIIEKVQKAIEGFSKAGSYLAKMLGIQTAATGEATAATTELDASMDANPIGLVVIAIAALAAGLVYAYNHVKWFHAAVDAVFKFLKTVVIDAIGFIRDHWQLILAILTGPFGLVGLFIYDHIGQILGFIKAIPGRIASIAGTLWSGITGAWDTAVHWIGTRGEDIITWFRNLPGHVVGALGFLGSAISAPFRAAFNLVARLWNDTIGKVHFSVPDWVPFVGGDGWGFPQMPTFHTGGVFRASGGEGFAKLKDGEGVFTPAQMRALGLMAMGGGGGGGAPQVFNFPAGISPSAVAAATRRHNRRNGKTD